MNILPSTAIQQDYKAISDLCRKSGEPVYFPVDGAGDLVVMDMESFIAEL